MALFSYKPAYTFRQSSHIHRNDPHTGGEEKEDSLARVVSQDDLSGKPESSQRTTTSPVSQGCRAGASGCLAPLPLDK